MRYWRLEVNTGTASDLMIVMLVSPLTGKVSLQSLDADCSCDDKMTRRNARAAILTNHAG